MRTKRIAATGDGIVPLAMIEDIMMAACGFDDGDIEELHNSNDMSFEEVSRTAHAINARLWRHRDDGTLQGSGLKIFNLSTFDLVFDEFIDRLYEYGCR